MREAGNGEDAAEAEGGWLDWLRDGGIPALTGVDTRALVIHTRNRGAMRGGIFPASLPEDAAVARVLAEPPMSGADLAGELSTPEPIELPGGGPHVVAIDTGVKLSILRQFRERGCRITLVPCRSSAAEVLDRDPDLVFLANGPGDPSALDYLVETARTLVGRVPIVGICLGHQILSRAIGLDTYKLPFGHRGVNHPVRDLRSGEIGITSQNHGFAVCPPAGRPIDPAEEPAPLDTAHGAAKVTHVNLYDRTIEGVQLTDAPVAGVQYHPEAGPGPHDSRGLFDRFLELAA